jgi:hypothetical protein
MAETPTLNTSTSVVDYLKSTGKDSSYTSRSQLATQYGIAGYQGTAAQNMQLLGLLRGGAPAGSASTPNAITPPTNVAEANSIINAGQQADAASAVDTPPVRKSFSDYLSPDNISKIRDVITPSTPAPDVPSFADRFGQLRTEQGVAPLEQRLNDLTQQEMEAQAALRITKNAVRGKEGIAGNVVAGRISEVERTAMEELDFISRQKSYVTNELNTKYSIINNMMSLEQVDYQNATARYEADFSKNVQTLNLVSGIADADITLEQQQETNARANLEIIYKQIGAGKLDISTLSSETATLIKSLETQSGLPIGFFETMKAAVGDAEPLSITTRQDSSGKKYVDIITRAPDGTLSLENMYVGNERLPTTATDKPNESELMRARTRDMAADLQKEAGSDGYVNTATFKEARNVWVQAGNSSDDFNDRFKGYANPNDPDYRSYGLGLIPE